MQRADNLNEFDTFTFANTLNFFKKIKTPFINLNDVFIKTFDFYSVKILCKTKQIIQFVCFVGVSAVCHFVAVRFMVL